MVWLRMREEREGERQKRSLERRRGELQRDLEKRRRQGLALPDEEVGKDKYGQPDKSLQPKVHPDLCQDTHKDCTIRVRAAEKV
jgi:hypothetical protein